MGVFHLGCFTLFHLDKIQEIISVNKVIIKFQGRHTVLSKVAIIIFDTLHKTD